MPPKSAATGPTHATGNERALVVDRKNMRVLWLEEKVARHEITDAQAREMLADQEGQGKLWTGPFKDGLGSVQIFYKIARDFASWKGARVAFTKSRAGHDLVIFKGWPAGRKIISGTRYRLDNPKIVDLQIGKPGLEKAAKESKRFGIWLVVAVDVADYLFNDKATLGSLLGSLSVDIPSVMLASAVATAAGTAVAGATTGVFAVVGAFALGPLAVAFVVGVVVGIALFEVDKYFHLSEKLGHAYDQGLAKLRQAWAELGHEAETRYHQLANSHFVHDLSQDAGALAKKLARQADLVRGELVHLW